MSNLYSVPLQNAVQRSLGNTLNQGETATITFSTSVSGVLQASASMPGLLVIDRVDANGTPTPSLTEYISFTGVSGSTVTGLTRGLSGTSDIAHSVGAIVEFVPDVTWAQAINDVFTTQHNADGTHKANAFSTLASSSIITSSLDTLTFNTNSVVLASNVSGAVNQVTFTNSLVSTSPRISATGTDTNISLGLYGKGTGRVYPYLQRGYKSNASLTTINSASRVDIGDLTFTFTPQIDAVCVVNAVLDLEVGATLALTAYNLVSNGSDVSSTAVIFQGTNLRATVGQNWVFDVNANTTYTIVLQGVRASGSGTTSVYAGNSTLNYFLLAR